MVIWYGIYKNIHILQPTGESFVLFLMESFSLQVYFSSLLLCCLCWPWPFLLKFSCNIICMIYRKKGKKNKSLVFWLLWSEFLKFIYSIALSLRFVQGGVFDEWSIVVVLSENKLGSFPFGVKFCFYFWIKDSSFSFFYCWFFFFFCWFGLFCFWDSITGFLV